MKKILFCILINFSIVSYANERAHFYLEFSDLSYVPTVEIKKDGTFNLITGNNEIDEIYDKYIIYNFEALLSNAISINLRKTYIIECNDIQMMHELHIKFPNIYVMVEQFLPDEPLYTPDDFDIQVPILGNNFQPRHLEEINAEDAWDITHGNPNVIVGFIENSVYSNHVELIDKIVFSTNSGIISGSTHGTAVAGLIAGDTDNGVGLSSIGFDVSLAQGGMNQIINAGAKVVNMSYGSGFIPFVNSNDELVTIPSVIQQNMFNDLEQQNIVMVAAAGNGVGGNVFASQLTSNGLAINAENYSSVRHFPASYANVISVSTVGNWNQPNTTSTPFDNWINIHRVTTPPNTFYYGTGTPGMPVTETEIFHQHNDSIDIVVPAYRLQIVDGGWNGPQNYVDTHANGYWSGTSYSAPIVCGTIGLMLSVNFCLKPKEVESILKLTATNIENLPENIPYHGRLGGGSLNAFRAVEMANEMALPFGTVNVNDRILYRNWFYKLETAPFEIKMFDNLVTEGAKIKFVARDNIEILSGDYSPDIGYVDLQINPNSSLSCAIPSSRLTQEKKSKKDKKEVDLKIKLYPNPNKGTFKIDLADKNLSKSDVNITIFDVFGKQVYSSISNENQIEINIENLQSGVYLIRLNSNEISKIFQFIKD